MALEAVASLTGKVSLLDHSHREAVFGASKRHQYGGVCQS